MTLITMKIDGLADLPRLSWRPGQFSPCSHEMSLWCGVSIAATNLLSDILDSRKCYQLFLRTRNIRRRQREHLACGMWHPGSIVVISRLRAEEVMALGISSPAIPNTMGLWSAEDKDGDVDTRSFVSLSSRPVSAVTRREYQLRPVAG